MMWQKICMMQHCIHATNHQIGGYFWAFENSLPPACLVEEDVTEVPSGVVVPDGPYFLNDIIPWDNLSAEKNSVGKFQNFEFSYFHEIKFIFHEFFCEIKQKLWLVAK